MRVGSSTASATACPVRVVTALKPAFHASLSHERQEQGREPERASENFFLLHAVL